MINQPGRARSGSRGWDEMSEDKKYNGWTNYETWAVNLWLENEERTYFYWRAQAESHRTEAQACDEVKNGIWTTDEAAKFNLADQLKNELENESPISEASLYSDLLNAALTEVNWPEVAESFLDGLEPENSNEVKK